MKYANIKIQFHFHKDFHFNILLQIPGLDINGCLPVRDKQTT